MLNRGFMRALFALVGLWSVERCLQADEQRSYMSLPAQPKLFDAMRDGLVTTEIVAPSSRSVWLRVTNKTDHDLHIELPDAFAGVPVLAQVAGQGALGNPFGGGGGFLGGPLGRGFANQGLGNQPFGQGLGNQGLGNQGLGGQGQGSQGLGGGFNNVGNGQGNALGNGWGNNGQLPGLGIFRVPAGKTGKVQAQTVCLEHGKPEPNPHMKYQIVPLNEFASKDSEQLAEVCRLLASKQITQQVAQAAAWHIANDLSWDELAAKNNVRPQSQGNAKYFTAREIEAARAVVGFQ